MTTSFCVNIVKTSQKPISAFVTVLHYHLDVNINPAVGSNKIQEFICHNYFEIENRTYNDKRTSYHWY